MDFYDFLHLIREGVAERKAETEIDPSHPTWPISDEELSQLLDLAERKYYTVLHLPEVNLPEIIVSLIVEIESLKAALKEKK